MAEVERDRALVRQSVIEPSPLQKHQPGAVRTEQYDGLFFAAVEGSDVDDNYVFVYGPASVAHITELAEALFGDDAYAITVESGANDALEEWLQTNGWIVCEDEPQMILRPIPRVDLPATELTIEVVENERQYEDFMRVSETGRRWVPSLQAATDPQVALLVGSYQGQTIATSRLSCLGEIGNIHGVVTDPKFRRRGIGTAMTWAAIAEARKRGCTSIVLSASEMGYPVYRRMGFQTVCRFRIYVPAGTPV